MNSTIRQFPFAMLFPSLEFLTPIRVIIPRQTSSNIAVQQRCDSTRHIRCRYRITTRLWLTFYVGMRDHKTSMDLFFVSYTRQQTVLVLNMPIVMAVLSTIVDLETRTPSLDLNRRRDKALSMHYEN